MNVEIATVPLFEAFGQAASKPSQHALLGYCAADSAALERHDPKRGSCTNHAPEV